MSEPIAARPEDEAPEGYRYEWVPAASWTVGGDGRLCSMLRCSNKAVAVLERPYKNRYGFSAPRRYHYCEDHLYGRRIENGVVHFRRLVPLEKS
jgi:hypothetical protein